MRSLLSLLLIVFLFSLIIVNSQPFGPPLYIADPVAMKCRYYFAGDARHFNPRLENYTINIGYTTDFKSEAQACEFFRCVYTNGTVLVDENQKPIEKDLCICRESTIWNNETGCVQIKEEEKKASFFQWFKNLFKRVCSKLD